MTNKKTAVFSCLGLGDGLITLVLSNNLRMNGFEVTTYHPSLMGLQKWFPELSIKPFPTKEKLADELKEVVHIFIIYEKSPWMQTVLEYCLKTAKEKTTILNPIPSKKQNCLYWSHGRFDVARSFVENMYIFCRDILKLSSVTKTNGIVPFPNLLPSRFHKRVVIHPTSSRLGKNWPKEKFISLAKRLEQLGFEPIFILSAEERIEWGDEHAPLFLSLDEVAAYIYESYAMIGNDSGIGHLASCLGLPTLIICRSPLLANFWHPDWSLNRVVLPSLWIPNIKGFRLRDKYWKKWISVDKVLTSFVQHIAKASKRDDSSQ